MPTDAGLRQGGVAAPAAFAAALPRPTEPQPKASPEPANANTNGRVKATGEGKHDAEAVKVTLPVARETTFSTAQRNTETASDAASKQALPENEVAAYARRLLRDEQMRGEVLLPSDWGGR